MIPATLLDRVSPELEPVSGPKWVSIDMPEISAELTDEDVFLCDECDGLGDHCPCCRGYGLVNGYDSNLVGYPVVLRTNYDPEIHRPYLHPVPERLALWRAAQGSRAVS